MLTDKLEESTLRTQKNNSTEVVKNHKEWLPQQHTSRKWKGQGRDLVGKKFFKT